MTLRDEIRAAMEWAAPYMIERIAEFIEAREAKLVQIATDAMADANLSHAQLARREA